jgi:PadR family transcriptional regulator, regulatory protein PadR
MARTDSLQGSLPVLILKILDWRGPLHGYGITAFIEQMSSNVLRVEEGSIYPALYRMEEQGWIRAKWVTTENKRRARTYEITAAGRKQLNAEEARWNAISAAVGHILKHA